MSWKLAGDFLSRFSKFKPPKQVIQDDVIEIINKIIGVKLEPQDIVVNNNTVFIKTKNNLLRNEVFIKKEKILEALKEKLGKRITDLRF